MTVDFSSAVTKEENISRGTASPAHFRTIRWPFIAFSVLATIHFPLYEVNDKAVGIFDLAAVICGVSSLFWLGRFNFPKVIPFPAVGFILLMLFTLYAGVTLATNWNRAMLSLIPDENYAFPALLYIKQIEYLLVILSTRYLARNINAITLALGLSLSLLVVSVYGFYAMFVAKIWYRLGLVNMSGEVSSNPGGFVLSICLLSLVGLIIHHRMHLGAVRWFAFFAIAGGYLALIFSFSRTNNLAFLVCCSVLLLPRLRRRLFLIVLVLVPVVIGSNAMFSSFNAGQEMGHYGISPLKFLAHPALILNDPSLRLRIEEIWGSAFYAWSSSQITMLFGIGFGKLRLADGLYPNLLFTTGVIGLLIYLAAFAVSAWRSSLLVRCLILFVLLNGISTETTINSFRSAQVLYTYLPALMILLHRMERTHNNFFRKATTGTGVQ